MDHNKEAFTHKNGPSHSLQGVKSVFSEAAGNASRWEKGNGQRKAAIGKLMVGRGQVGSSRQPVNRAGVA